MGKKILSEDSSERLVAAYEKTKDLANVALMFEVAKITVYRLVAQKIKTDSLALKFSDLGVKSKLTPVIVEQIKQKIKEMPDITLKELIDGLNIPIKVSAFCGFIFNKLKLTQKKTIHAPERECSEVIVQHKNWEKFTEEVDVTKRVFLDKSDMNIGLTRNYGRNFGQERVKDTYHLRKWNIRVKENLSKAITNAISFVMVVFPIAAILTCCEC